MIQGAVFAFYNMNKVTYFKAIIPLYEETGALRAGVRFLAD